MGDSTLLSMLGHVSGRCYGPACGTFCSFSFLFFQSCYVARDDVMLQEEEKHLCGSISRGQCGTVNYHPR